MISILAIACHEQEGSSLGDIDFGVLTPDQKTEKTLTLQFNAEAQNDPNAFVQFVFLTKAGDEFPKDQICFLVNGKIGILQTFDQLFLRITPDWAQRAIFPKVAGILIIHTFIQRNRAIDGFDYIQ